MKFKYYLHDDYDRGEFAQNLIEKGADPEAARKAADQRPFYEVTLECELDEETGEVTLLSARL